MHSRRLTPCFIGSGTLARPRDMVRALETIEGFHYVYEVDGETIAQGRAGLVKLMADASSATLLVNACLFLNVASFRYMTFGEQDGEHRFELFGDGSRLTLVSIDDPEERPARPLGIHLLEEDAYDCETFVVLDDDEDDE
ncbi:MAG: hypothetical protein IBX62_01990 [Coriobacteriia bacterium]|nr:hypothetical protein [Coriobacteriia bacterium]